MEKSLTIRMSAKCSDMFVASLVDEDGKQLGKEYVGYVPAFMPGGGGSEDYVDLEINVETGQIENWVTPTKKELKQAFGVVL